MPYGGPHPAGPFPKKGTAAMNQKKKEPTKKRLLQLLIRHPGKFLSGQRLGESLGVSRNAIWKAAAQLREEGFTIESRTNAGYRLIPGSDPLSESLILPSVKSDADVTVLDTVTSTNDLVKKHPLNRRPIVFIANRQTKGRGRLGRTFVSPGGSGIYMSFGLVPDFAIDQSPFVTMAAAVAVCRAIEKVCNIKPAIKWVNDIFYRDKKICGILTEAQTNFETGNIDQLIIGIGVNCFPGSFPPELQHIAGSIAEEPGSFSRSLLAAEIVNEVIAVLGQVESRLFLPEYRNRCFILGEKILVRPNYGEGGTLASALSIEDDGGLRVRYLEGPDAGKTETLHTGEISISEA